MNVYVADILSHYGDKHIKHYGVKYRSGRYPYGSGENPYQHSGNFLSRANKLQSEGLSESEIAKSLGLTTSQFRTQVSLASTEEKAVLKRQALDLQSKGYSNSEIADKLDLAGESTVRSLVNSTADYKMAELEATYSTLKDQVEAKGEIDIGSGVARNMGISDNRLNQSVELLRMEGYNVYNARMEQVTNKDQKTTVKLLCKKDIKEADIYETLYDEDGKIISSGLNTDKIHSVDDVVSRDGGVSFEPTFVYPKSMDSSRLSVRYAEDGGSDKDGLIEIRPGVEDLSLGESRYAQVRILVDDTHYLKGMAVYSNDLPDGVDVVFNTNKSDTGTKTDALKSVKEVDVENGNPFGSLIKDGISDPSVASSTREGGQSYYIDADGNKQLSLINKTATEGDWGKWSKTLPSQFLGKQNKELIKSQLDKTIEDVQSEYDEICELTNPTIKRHLLEQFASESDSAAVDLQAAGLPRQSYQVILPLSTISDTEVYAPNYNNGETVALVRYPHAGTFEIPILKVNNGVAEGQETITSTAKDAIGISSKVAAQLSGADFDGDTVMVIPCNSSSSKVNITSRSYLKDLEGFDPKLEYGTIEKDGSYYNSSGKKVSLMSESKKQNEMGVVSNLITDMTLKGASDADLAKAVKHSMVVIDSVKHNLDYKQSEIDNDINTLKQRYQMKDDGTYGGASTLLSRAKSPIRIRKRQGSAKVNEDGSLSYKEADPLFTDKNGVDVYKTQKVHRMEITDDAYTLSSGTIVENYYAEYANTRKAMANAARVEARKTGNLTYSSSANKTYAKEVSELTSALKIAESNAPLERKAQALANSKVKAIKQSNPSLDSKSERKIRQQAITEARASVGAKRHTITITPKQWEAIQAGAITDNTLTKILKYTDISTVRDYATPKSTTQLSTAKQNKIKAMSSSGAYTIAEIAASLGCSTSTVKKYMS